jgi:hypothetical protein
MSGKVTDSARSPFGAVQKCLNVMAVTTVYMVRCAEGAHQKGLWQGG